MKYYAGLGKRAFIESDEYLEDSDTSSLEKNLRENFNFPVKRLDKLKYYGGLGKRAFTGSHYDKKSVRRNSIDKLRYMGNIGK